MSRSILGPPGGGCVVVNALLVGIWAMTTSPEFFWPMWPILGWGIGVAAHGVAVVVGPSQISEDRINRELEALDGSRSVPQARR